MVRQKELKRLHVIQKVLERVIKQVEAAEILFLSSRQMRRIIKRIRIEGDRGSFINREASYRTGEFRGFSLVFISKPFGGETSWQEILAFRGPKPPKNVGRLPH
jgi:hypothetical protein